MSVKSKMLEQVNKAAEKIRARRIIAANNKTLEAAVFEFFKNIEESRQIHGGSRYDRALFTEAYRALQGRVRGFDVGTKVTIEFNVNTEATTIVAWEYEMVRGVTIWWSNTYIAKHNVDPTLYIDVSAMFLD